MGKKKKAKKAAAKKSKKKAKKAAAKKSKKKAKKAAAKKSKKPPKKAKMLATTPKLQAAHKAVRKAATHNVKGKAHKHKKSVAKDANHEINKMMEANNDPRRVPVFVATSKMPHNLVGDGKEHSVTKGSFFNGPQHAAHDIKRHGWKHTKKMVAAQHVAHKAAHAASAIAKKAAQVNHIALRLVHAAKLKAEKVKQDRMAGHQKAAMQDAKSARMAILKAHHAVKLARTTKAEAVQAAKRATILVASAKAVINEEVQHHSEIKNVVHEDLTQDGHDEVDPDIMQEEEWN